MAFPAVGICTESFFSASKTAAWPLQTLPCSVQSLLERLLANAHGFASCRGSAQSLFFLLPRLPLGPFKPFPAASSRFWNGCLLMPMAFPAVGDLHRAFVSASKTAAWPLQSFPCSVQSLLERLLANAHGFASCQGSAQSLFFPLPRLPLGPFKPFPAASSGLSTCCLANANGFASCRGSAQCFSFQFQDRRLAPSNPSLQRPVANANGFPSWRGSAQSSFFGFQRPNLGLQRQNGLWNGCVQKPMAFPAVGDLHRARFSGSQRVASNGLWNGCVQKPMAFPAVGDL